MKLELGAGLRPSRGYTHNDAQPFPHIEIVGDPWMIDLPDNSLDEVLALAFIEHLTYEQALDTFRNVHRMLRPGGCFLFDVPDYPVWCAYYLNHISPTGVVAHGKEPDLDHVRRTLFGWARWPGDNHLYGWDRDHLNAALELCGMDVLGWTVEPFKQRTFRQRFDNARDAHLYVCAVK